MAKKAPKAPKGSLYKKNGYYYARIYYYVDGKRKSKDQATGIVVDNSTARKSKKQEREATHVLEEALRNFCESEQKTATVDTDQMLVDTVQAWLKHVSGSRAPSTVSSYTYIARDIVLYFSTYLPVRTADLTSAQVEAYLDWERQRRQPGYSGEHGVRSQYADGSGIESTVHHRYTILRTALNYAKREGIVSRNVAAKYDCHISPPKPQRHEFAVLSEAEGNELAKALLAEDLWFRCAVLLGLFMGLRRSEIIGLRFSDIDYAAGTLTVRRTATQQTIDHHNTVILKPCTKSRKPRSIPLTPSLIYVLRTLEQHHQHNSAVFGSDYITQWDGHLIRYPDGKLVSPNVLTQRFRLFIRKHNFKTIRFHDLRHSCASILYANGVDFMTLQLLMGHAQISTTRTYTHVINDRMDAAMAKMDSILMPDALLAEEGLKIDRKTDRHS